MVTVVADREADIYPTWATVPEANFHMLGRAMKDRLLAGGGTLFAAAATFPLAGQRKIELRSHDPAHPKRTAVVELRYGAVEICRPQTNATTACCPPYGCGWLTCGKSIPRREWNRCIGGC